MLDKNAAYKCFKKKIDAHQQYLIRKFNITDEILNDAFNDAFLYTIKRYDPTKGSAMFSMLWQKLHWRILELKGVDVRQGMSYLSHSDSSPCLTCNINSDCKNHENKKCIKVKVFVHSAKGRKYFHKQLQVCNDVLMLESMLETRFLITNVAQINPQFLIFATELLAAINSTINVKKVKSIVVKNVIKNTELSRGYVYTSFNAFLEHLKYFVKKNCSTEMLA
jgi:hypothetical protein